MLPVGHPNYSVNGFPSPPFPLFALPTRAFRASTNSPFFSPTSIAGCTLFLDASDPAGTGTPPANGSTVSTWVDKSGLGNNFSGSATYGLDATYNKYRLNFGGNTFNKVGASSLVTNSTYCIFTVHRFYSNSGGPGHIYRGGGNWFRQHNQFVNWITDRDPEGYIYVNANDIGINGIGCLNTPTTTSAVGYLNGTSVGSSLKGSGTNFSFTIGGEGLSAAIFEILVYNIGLTDSQRQQVEGYLAWKWGIQGSLPGAHPNYSVNGTVVGPFPLSVLPTTPFKIQILPFNVTTTFTYTGADQTYVVPANITRITVYMWAAGGQGTTTINGSFYGGAGAYVQGVLAVTPGETLTIYVGQRGTPGPTFAYKNGGYNSAGDLGTGTAGGRSGIARSSTNIVAVGAGGGGGGNGNGGAGGISSGSAGTGTNPGGGGTQSAGGTAASSSYNSGGVGQNFGGGTGPGAYGGSGGDGFYGGGGGAAFGSGQLGGGGGGGSSLTSNLTSLVTFVSSNGYSAPNTSSPYYTSNIAAGGLGTSGTAGNGLVVILYSN